MLTLPSLATAQQTPLQRQEQRRRAKRQAMQRRHQRQQPVTRLSKTPPTNYHQLNLPKEKPCFTLHALRLTGKRTAAFDWVSDYLNQYVGRCVGQRGINLIVKRASDLILARGYVTTRLLIPQQDLSSGILKLLLVPGLVGKIRYAPGSDHVVWRNALPLRPGDLLNLRAIEQGLDQLRRVPSQTAHINIAPGNQPGVSDLVLNVRHTRRWRYFLRFNDAGSQATGKDRGGLSFAIDQPFGINDLLSFGATRNIGYPADQRAQSHNLRYSVPWDYWTFALTYSKYTYRQEVQGAGQSFPTSGRSRHMALSAKYLLTRDADSTTSLRLTLSGQQSHSSIDGVEIKVQRRDTRAVSLALLQRLYIGHAQLDWSLARRRGVPWFGGQHDVRGIPDSAPTFGYTVNLLNISLSIPFTGLGEPMLWSSTLHAQSTTDRLYADDFITIGGRYTVRGFDEQRLGGEHGWFWRNKVGLPLGRSGVRLYGGIDVGQIGGPDARTRFGHSLSGAFIGLRGVGYGFRWNVFAGWALHAPDNFSTSRPAAGMQVVYQF